MDIHVLIVLVDKKAYGNILLVLSKTCVFVNRFDEENKGFIAYQDFLEKIGASEFTPGDLVGPSTRIIDHSRRNLEDHNDTQQQKHERITMIQAQRAGYMSIEQIEQALK